MDKTLAMIRYYTREKVFLPKGFTDRQSCQPKLIDGTTYWTGGCGRDSGSIHGAEACLGRLIRKSNE